MNIAKNNQEVLKELEKTSQDFWNISPQTANFLNMLIKITKAKNVLEIGTSNGYSAIWLAMALQETGGHLTTIEFWDNRLDMAKKNFEKCSVSSVITTKLGSAFNILQNEIDDEFDFVFIDANKSEYIKYFELIHPMLKKDGIIAADNITSHWEKVLPFVNAIKNHKDYQVEILDLPAGLLLAHKS